MARGSFLHPRIAVAALAVVLLSTAGVHGRWSHLTNGATCMFDSSMNPVKPFCDGGQQNCLITQTPTARNNKFTGRCNSTLTGGSYCSFAGVNYAIGTKNIKDNPLCDKCSCSLKPDMPGTNKAVCKCDTLPACFVDYKGKPVGDFTCPPKQFMCVVTAMGAGGKDKDGLPIDKGECVFSGIPGICAVAGLNFGPKFYMPGLVGIPKTPDGCTRCTCGATGGFLNCAPLAGCNKAHPASLFATMLASRPRRFIAPHLQVR